MRRVMIESGPNDFLRMVTPFAFRNHIGVDGDVCLFFTTICTALQREQLTDLWDMARTVSDQLAGGRSVPGLFGASAAEQLITVDAPTTDPEGFLVGRPSYEASASNLGVLDMGTAEAVRPVAIWGPAILMQAEGELPAPHRQRRAPTRTGTTSTASATSSTPLAGAPPGPSSERGRAACLRLAVPCQGYQR
jgi:hypothetical protein